MIKPYLAGITLCLCVVPAHAAETITFLGSPCDANRNCYPVLTDDPADLVQIYVAAAYPPTIYVNAVPYYGTISSGYSDINTTVTDVYGNQGVLVATFSYYKTLVRSGRGQHYVTHWSITGGSFSR
jgi:hypothetical protein